MMNLTIGCDPELQIIGLKGIKGGNCSPAWELTKGTKSKPELVLETTVKGLAVQADGVALEFNIAPHKLDSILSCGDFVDTIQLSIISLRNKYGRSLGYEPTCSNYTPEDLKHPLALAYGCDPDFDAYSNIPTAPRIIAESAINPKVKFFGGHVHVGYDLTLCPPNIMAQLMDLFWYGSMQHEHQGLRRAAYGRAGIFRPKPYGVEYRTPSAQWTSDDRATFNLATSVFNIGFYLNHFRNDVISLYKTVDWRALKIHIDDENFDLSERIAIAARHKLTSLTGLAWQTEDEPAGREPQLRVRRLPPVPQLDEPEDELQLEEDLILDEEPEQEEPDENRD
jgi:hypothetical protein